MVRGFVLGVVLLATIGICIVQETNKQTQARYLLNELERKEQVARQRLAKLRTDEERLRAPSRLVALVQENKLKLVVLGTGVPTAVPGGALRRPGQVLDAEPETVPEMDLDAEIAIVF